MPGGFKYPSSSDIDPNVVDLLYRAIKPKLDSLIDDRQQRRQVWGPTFKQEGIRVLSIADANYVVPAPEYGKRTLIFTGALTAERRVELPALAGAWWIIRNDTAGAIKTVAGADGVTGPVIPIGESAAVYTDGHVVWTFPTVAVGGGGGGTGALPDGVDTELQARAGPTTFKRVTYSITSDQHVSLAGQFTVTLPPPLHTESRIVIECTAQHPKMTFTKYLTTPDPILIEFNKAGGTATLPLPLADGEEIGALRFRGWSGSPAAFNSFGYLDVSRIDPQGAVVVLGAGELNRAYTGITDNGTVASAGLYAAALPSGSHYFQVQTYGHVISGGTTGSIWFKAEPSGGIAYYVPLDINPALDNGKVLTVVETGPSTGVFLPKWMPPPGGSGGGAPGLPDWSLQYRQNATTFGGVTSSIVTGANIVLGGELAFHNVASTDQHVRVSAIGTDPAILMAKFAIAGAPTFFFRKGRGTHALPEAVSDGDTIGGILFQGHDGTAEWPVNGYLRVFLDPMPDYSGNIVELGAGNFDEALVRVTNNGTVGSAGLYAAAWLWQVQTGGLVSSFGQTGSMLYKAPGGAGTPSIGYMWDLPIGEEGQVLTVAESTHPTFGDYLHPKWAAPSTGALPEGDFHELQSRWDATTFKRVLNSEVTGAAIKLAGNLTLSDVVGHTLFFEQTTPIGSAQQVGLIWFREYLPVVGETVYGYVRAYREDVWVVGTKVVEMGQSAARRMYISDLAASLDYDGHFFHVRTDGLRISGGVQGSLFYQEGAPPTGPIYTPLDIDPTGTKWLKSDGARPVWATLPAGTVTSPGGDPTELQFHKTGGTFEGITGSSTDGTNVWLTGFLNVNKEVVINEAPSYVTFRGDAGTTIHGFIRGFGPLGNGVMEIACGLSGVGPRVEIQEIGTTALLAGTNFFRVHTDGTLLAIGDRGSLYFKGDLDYLVPLDILGTVPAPVYLKGTGDLPFWATLGWGDISGVVPISKGGTGTGTAPGPGYLLIGKADGSYVPAILTEDTGILITEGDGTITIKCTVTPGTGATPPGGSYSQIQYHAIDDTFDGIDGSSVDSANIGLGGNITVTSTAGQELYFNRTTNVTGVVGGSLGQIAFRDGSTAVGAPKAFVRAYWTNVFSAGYVLELYRTDARRLYITDIGAQMDWDGKFFQIVAGGIRVSGGSVGCVFIQDSNNYHVGLPAPLVTGQFLKSDGGLPYWADAPSGPGGATPGSPNLSLQYNNGSTFAGIDGVKVVTAGSPNLMFGGYLQLVASWTQATSTSDIDQEFFISARKSTSTGNEGYPVGTILPTRFTMRCFRADNVWPYIQFDRGRGNAGSVGLVQHSDIVGELRFAGHRGETHPNALPKPTVLGSVVSWWDSGVGGVIRVGAMNGGGRVELSDTGSLAAATLHAYSSFFQVQNAGFRISIGTVGAIYYQSHTGSQTQLVELNSSSGALGNVLTLVSGFATEAGSLVPRWQAPAGGPGGSPGTPANSLQWNNGSTFDGVENSIVTTGGLVTLGEQSNTQNNALLTLQKTRAANADVGNGDSVGRISFQGKLGSMQDFGVLEGLYNTTPMRTLRLGQGLAASAYRVIALRDSGEIYLEVSNGSQVSNLKVQATGVTLTPGTGTAVNFGTYVRDGSGFIVTVGPGAVGTYLRSSSISSTPSWQTLSFGDFTSGTLPLVRGGTGASLSTPSAGRILYYSGSAVTWLSVDSTLTVNTSTHVLSVTTPGGSVSPPLTLTYSTTVNQPTFTVDHTESGSGTITDVYGERFYFHMSHSGAVSGAGGRKGVSMTWDHTNSGSGSVSTDGDTILQLYAQNTGSLGLSSYKLSALTIDGYLPANYGTFTGIRIKGMNATTRRAIMCDYGSGDVVINAGTQLSPSSTWGFLYISAVSSGPSSGSINSIVPVGTCAVVWDYNLKRVCFNDGSGWRYITMTGSF